MLTYCHVYECAYGLDFGLTAGFIGLFDTARDYTLQFTITYTHTYTSVHSYAVARYRLPTADVPLPPDLSYQLLTTTAHTD
jgi:hypothetical protein